MRINEIETINFSNSDTDMHYMKLRGEVIGKVAGYELFAHENGSTSIVLALANPDRVTNTLGSPAQGNPDDLPDILVYMELVYSKEHKAALKPFIQAHDSVRKSGLVIKLYEYVIKKLGKTLIADEMQSRGGKSVWAKLARVSGINVYGWNPKKDEYFAWDPDDSPDEEVYTTQTSEIEARLYKLDLFRDKLEQRLEDMTISEDDFDEMIERIAAEKEQLLKMTQDNKNVKDIRLVATAA